MRFYLRHAQWRRSQQSVPVEIETLDGLIALRQEKGHALIIDVDYKVDERGVPEEVMTIRVYDDYIE